MGRTSAREKTGKTCSSFSPNRPRKDTIDRISVRTGKTSKEDLKPLVFTKIMTKPERLCSILEETLKTMGIAVPMKPYSLWGAWKEVVGDAVASNTRPSGFRNRILFIDVSHPTWVQQLQFLKPTLLEKMNLFLREPLLQDIRFKLGKIPPTPPPPEKKGHWKEERLQGKTMDRIESLLQQVGDEEAQKAMREVFIKGAKLEQYRKKSTTL